MVVSSIEELRCMHQRNAGILNFSQEPADSPACFWKWMSDPNGTTIFQGMFFEFMELAKDGRFLNAIIEENVSVGRRHMKALGGLIGRGTAGGDTINKKEPPVFDDGKDFIHLPLGGRES